MSTHQVDSGILLIVIILLLVLMIYVLYMYNSEPVSIDLPKYMYNNVLV